MSTIKKISLLLLIALAAPLLLSGCLKFNLHLTVNRNRTADLEITLVAPAALLTMEPELEKKFFKDKREELAAQGFAVSDYEGDNLIGFRATKRLHSVEDLADLQLAGDLGLKGREVFTAQKSAFTTTYLLDTDLDLSNLMGEQSKMLALFTPDLRFVLTLPVKPLAHNATAVTADERTLEWSLSPTGNNHLQLTARAPNLSAVIVVIVIAVMVPGSIIIIVVYRPILKQARLNARGPRARK